MYAEDISRCASTPCHPNDNDSATTVYEDSLFNLPNIFEGSHSNTTRYSCLLEVLFITAFSKLLFIQ